MDDLIRIVKYELDNLMNIIKHEFNFSIYMLCFSLLIYVESEILACHRVGFTYTSPLNICRFHSNFAIT